MTHRARLKSLLVSPPAMGERRGRRAAAVLVPVVEHKEGAHLLLIRRTKHLTHHAGEIAFPGGAVEASDATMQATALREAHEEVGLPPQKVEVAGFLAPYPTIANAPGFVIQPVVGFVPSGLAFTGDTYEVAELLEVPLDWAMNPAHHRRERVFWRGKWRSYYVMQWQQHRIWGATAGIIRDLYERSFAT